MRAKPNRIGPHARFEVGRRGIKRADVLATNRSPGQVLPSRRRRDVYQSVIGRAGPWLLRVIVREDALAYDVVTADKTRRIARSWRAP
jgi:hypothetical protein